MSSAPSQHPLLSARRPWWQPIVALAISLYGLVVDGWGMQAIVFLFWWETILIIFSGYLRVLFALDGKPVLATVPIKLVTLAFGVVMGGAMIALAVVFSIEGMTSPGDDSVGSTRVESSLLLASYALGLLFHYFLNGRFRTANPAGEMYASLAHVLVLLVIIMPITQHLLPKYPHLDRAVWGRRDRGRGQIPVRPGVHPLPGFDAGVHQGLNAARPRPKHHSTGVTIH